MKKEVKLRYCFPIILRSLTIFALPIEPLNMSAFLRILYGIYCVVFLVVFPIGYLISQILEIPRVKDDLKLVSCVMGYVFSDSLGENLKTLARRCAINFLQD